MKNTVLVAIACLLGGGAAGYLVGQGGGDSAPKESVASSSVKVSDRSARGSSGSDQSSDRNADLSYEEITAQPGQTARVQGLIELYSKLDPSEFKDEADKLDGLPFSERILSSFLLFSAWAEVAPYDAMAHTKTMGRAGFFVKPTVLQSWAATDPSGAASYFQSNKGEFAMMGMMGGRGQGGAGVIAAEWAKQDLDGAMQWAKTLEGQDSGQATSGVLAELAKTDAARASQMLGTLGDAAGDRAYDAIAREWAKEDWTATESWIEGLPEDQQSGARANALRSLAGNDPTKAAQEVLALPEGDAKVNAFEDVAEIMSKDNAAETMDWVMKNGNEEAQKESVGRVVGNWVGQDPGKALSWINEQPEGGVRDEAAQAYVFSNSSGDPRETMAVAESIGDEGSRNRAMGMNAMRWMGEDRDAAMQYVESTDAMSEDSKKRFMDRANGGGWRGRGR